MAPSAPRRAPLSRRSLLGGVAGLAAGGSLSTAATRAPALTVATRNLYLGVDLTRLFLARSMDDVRRIAGEMLAEVEAHPYAARMEAIAAEVETSRPDVLGVQEAGSVRTQRPSDFDEDPSPNASDVRVDLLALLASKLDDRGLDYEVAASTVTTDVEVPADDDGETVDVRLTDRTALLVREEVPTANARAGTFETVLSFSVNDATVSLERGYCLADVTAEDEVTVATAHLESTAPGRRLDQARELRDLLPADRRVALAGDFNSGPGGSTDAYDLLTESFEDAHAALRPDDDGFTCCQDADLRNEGSQLSRRIDGVLVSRGLEPTAVERVGADPDDRVRAEVDGEAVDLWPSDHAGVVATVEATQSTPTATPTATPTDAPTSTGTPTDAQSNSGGDAPSITLPGFGPLAALVAFVLAALARRRDAD